MIVNRFNAAFQFWIGEAAHAGNEDILNAAILEFGHELAPFMPSG